MNFENYVAESNYVAETNYMAERNYMAETNYVAETNYGAEIKYVAETNYGAGTNYHAVNARGKRSRRLPWLRSRAHASPHLHNRLVPRSNEQNQRTRPRGSTMRP